MSVDYDWDLLSEKVNPQKPRLKFDKVSHLFKKVAFDVYKQNGSDKLWELREEDGSQYLVALYEDDDNELVIESQETPTQWNATSDSDGHNVTLSYKTFPIARFASSEYNFQPDQAERFAQFLADKTEDAQFITELLNTMPEQKRTAVLMLINEEEA